MKKKLLLLITLIVVTLTTLGIIPLYGTDFIIVIKSITYYHNVENIPPNADNFWMPDMDKTEPSK